MPHYRRVWKAGGCFFFTVNLLERRSNLLVERIDGLRSSVSRVRTLMPFHVDAWVVLPEHMHCIWTLPAGDPDYARRWQAIKGLFSHALPKGETVSPSRRRKKERGIWQRRFWEHTIRDAADYAAHMDYTHFNPVKHGLVRDVADWPYSSFHRCVARGMYPQSWGGPDKEGGA